MTAPDNKNRSMARAVAQAAAAAGGRTFYVGGCVRDRLMGHESKDIDIEVHGLAPETLAHILDTLGERTEMGASFGIFGLKHYELDIAMPRLESATGRGHRDFAVSVDPFLGTYKAALRRDFTVNAMMEDVLTGEVVDHFGGRADLAAGVLRHVNDATFVEDPLRVLRAAQFAARFGFAVAPETRALARTMDLTALARERVWGELEKALTKAAQPSLFFTELRAVDQLGHWFPEVAALIGVPQEPRFHPEGDAWNHTMLVLDAAAALREKAAYPVGFMTAALCHDLGKVSTTAVIDGRIRSLGHETAGRAPALALLRRLSGEVRLRDYVLNLQELHMRPNACAAQRSKRRAFNRIFDACCAPDDLLLLSKADRMGQGFANEAEYRPTEEFLRARLAEYRETMAKPAVRGADLVALGYRPGPAFKEAMALAHQLRLADVPRDEALKQVCALLEKNTRQRSR